MLEPASTSPTHHGQAGEQRVRPGQTVRLGQRAGCFVKLHALGWAEIVLASVTVLLGGYYAVAEAVNGGLQGESASGVAWLLVLTALGLAGVYLLVAGWRHDRPVVRCVGLVLVVGSPTGFAWVTNAIVLALAAWEAVALLRGPRTSVDPGAVPASSRPGPGSPPAAGGTQ